MTDLLHLAAIANAEGALANKATAEASEKMSAGLVHALAAGAALWEAREAVPAEDWTAWLEEHIEYAVVTATAFVRLHYYRDQIEAHDGHLNIITAREFLNGLPSLVDGRNRGGVPAIPVEVVEQIRKVRAEGHTFTRVAEIVGVSRGAVQKHCDPDWNRKAAERNRKRREEKRALELEERRRQRDELAARSGDHPSAAYASIRKAAASLQRAIDGCQDPAQRKELRNALGATHKAEDALVASMRPARQDVAA